MAISISAHLLLAAGLLLVFSSTAQAFGSGNIAEYTHQNGRAFRHGDLEDVLLTLAKTMVGGAGLMGFIKQAAGGSSGTKFTKDDVAKIYFGNWCRDMSQALDVAGLKMMSAQQLTTIVAVLGFTSFGYATREFEVTEDRLGCYRAEEHIDNPKGYADAPDGAPRDVANYPKLRGPLDPRELEINLNTGLKNYIGTENRGWDTSTKFVRDNLVRAIEQGRRGRQGDETAQHESMRLLGTALHTLEDWPAHSNFTELCLVNLGYENVFCHVGDNVRIRSPDGRSVPPCVTGTFGGSDFMHSVLGEVGDKLSSTSISDVSTKLSQSQNADSNLLRVLLSKFLNSKEQGNADAANDDKPSNQEANDDVDRLVQIRKLAQQKGVDIDPDELGRTIKEVFTIHDNIRRKISSIIDAIPFLDKLLEETVDTLSVLIFATIAPILTPVLKNFKDVVYNGSAAVIDNNSQTEVFDDDNASDPTHSYLAKDHFGNILNAPAGLCATIIVKHVAQLYVQGVDDDRANAQDLANQALEVLHHPSFSNGRSGIQQEMQQFVRTWIESHGREKDEVLRRLEKQAVKEHRNTTDNLSGGSLLPSPEEQYQKYGKANEGLQGLVGKGGALADAPGANVIAGVLDSLSLKDRPQGYNAPVKNSESYNDQHNRFGDNASGGDHSFQRQQYSTGYNSQYSTSNNNQRQDHGSSYTTPQQDHHRYGGQEGYEPGQGNLTGQAYANTLHSSSGSGRKEHQNFSDSSYGQSQSQTGRTSYGQSQSSGYGEERQSSSYGGRNEGAASSYYSRPETTAQHGSGRTSYEREEPSSASRYGSSDNQGYGSSSHGRPEPTQNTYGRQGRDDSSSYGREDASSRYGQHDSSSRFGQEDTSSRHGHQQEDQGYGRQTTDSSSRYGRADEDRSEYQQQQSYGQQQTYGSGRNHDSQASYGRQEEHAGYGQEGGQGRHGRRHGSRDEDSYGSRQEHGYGRD